MQPGAHCLQSPSSNLQSAYFVLYLVFREEFVLIYLKIHSLKYQKKSRKTLAELLDCIVHHKHHRQAKRLHIVLRQ